MIEKLKILQEFKSIVAWKETENYELTEEITAAPLIINNIYKINEYKTGDDFSNVANVIEGVINTDDCVFQATGTTPLVYSNDSKLEDITLIYNFSNYYVNDIPGIDLISIEKMLKLDNTLETYETIYQYLTRIYDVEVLKAIDEFLFFVQNKFQKTNKAQNYDLGKFHNVSSNVAPSSFIGLMVSPEYNYYNINKIYLKSSITQTLRIYLFDVLSSTPLEYVDMTVEAGKVSIVPVDWLIEERNSENVRTNYVIGFFVQSSDNIDPKNLLISSELLPIYFENAEITPINIYNAKQNEITFENVNFSACSFFNVSYNYDNDYTELLTENKTLLANYIAYKIALRVIEDALSSKEFNNITESNRKVWQNMILNFRNIIYGYNFENEKGTGRQPGLLEELFIAFQGKNENLFPKIKKMTI